MFGSELGHDADAMIVCERLSLMGRRTFQRQVALNGSTATSLSCASKHESSFRPVAQLSRSERAAGSIDRMNSERFILRITHLNIRH